LDCCSLERQRKHCPAHLISRPWWDKSYQRADRDKENIIASRMSAANPHQVCTKEANQAAEKPHWRHGGDMFLASPTRGILSDFYEKPF